MIQPYSSPENIHNRKRTDQFFLEGCTYYVQEKVDGSQLSITKTITKNGELQLVARSRGAVININEPPKMFKPAIDAVRVLDLHPNWIYRGECVSNRRHNVLLYERVPVGCFIIFDIETEQGFLDPYELEKESCRIGLESVPLLGTGFNPPTEEKIEKWLANTSILGGCLVEGVVLKNYMTRTQDGTFLMVKIVSEKFKETHSSTFKKEHTPVEEIPQVVEIIALYGSEARWAKAVQHLREQAILTDSERDIGLLLKEIAEDFEKECAEEIGEDFVTYRKQILKGIQNGFPLWYKKLLLNKE